MRRAAATRNKLNETRPKAWIVFLFVSTGGVAPVTGQGYCSYYGQYTQSAISKYLIYNTLYSLYTRPSLSQSSHPTDSDRGLFEHPGEAHEPFALRPRRARLLRLLAVPAWVQRQRTDLMPYWCAKMHVPPRVAVALFSHSTSSCLLRTSPPTARVRSRRVFPHQMRSL